MFWASICTRKAELKFYKRIKKSVCEQHVSSNDNEQINKTFKITEKDIDKFN